MTLGNKIVGNILGGSKHINTDKCSCNYCKMHKDKWSKNSEMHRIIDGENYSLFSKGFENKTKNPNAQAIVKFIEAKGKTAKAIGGRVYIRDE